MLEGSFWTRLSSNRGQSSIVSWYYLYQNQRRHGDESLLCSFSFQAVLFLKSSTIAQNNHHLVSSSSKFFLTNYTV